MLSTPFKRFKWIAFLEGSSFLALIFISMPLKYFAEMPTPNIVFGLIHGLLTVMYLFALIDFKLNYSVNWKEFFLFLAAALVPFGTFYAEKRWLRPIGKTYREV